MKALVYTNPLELTLREEPDPVPGTGEVLLRIRAAGICGSDMHAFHGHDSRRAPPLILGHEAVAEVVEGASSGRRVVLNPLITCGRCDYCLGGRSNLCLDRKLIGMNRPGAFAELIAMPETSLIDVPADMDPVAAALTEPTATALHALTLGIRALSRPPTEVQALVLGGGSVGLLSALWLRAFGCTDIFLAETNPLRRASAERTGVCKTYDPIRASPARQNGIDLVIDAVGTGATRETSLAAVKPGGVVILVGLGDSRGDADFRKLTLAEITVIGSYTYSPVDLRASVNALDQGRLGTLDWVERRPLTAGARAFAELDQGATGSGKIVLLPEP